MKNKVNVLLIILILIAVGTICYGTFKIISLYDEIETLEKQVNKLEKENKELEEELAEGEFKSKEQIEVDKFKIAAAKEEVELAISMAAANYYSNLYSSSTNILTEADVALDIKSELNSSKYINVGTFNGSENKLPITGKDGIEDVEGDLIITIESTTKTIVIEKPW